MTTKTKITFAKLAKLCNVSPSTISIVFARKANKFRISPSTVNHILAVARQYEYDPKIKRAIARISRSNTIGIVVPNLLSRAFGGFLDALEREFSKSQIQLLILCSHFDQAKERAAVDTMIDRDVDGLMVISCMPNDEFYRDLDIPVVCIDRYFKDSCLPYVTTEARQSTCNMVKAHLDEGRSVYFVGPNDTTPSYADRYAGFVDGYKEKNIAFDSSYVLADNGSALNDGARLIGELWERITDPNAKVSMLCSTNSILEGALDRASELKIPVDRLSFIVYDYYAAMSHYKYPVTGIAHDYNKMSEICYQMLFSFLEQRPVKKFDHVVAPLTANELNRLARSSVQQD